MPTQWKYCLRLGITGALISITSYALNISLFGLMWMGIAAFIVMDVRMGTTLTAGINRILGTVSGAILGVILASVFNSQSLLITIINFAIIGSVSAALYVREKSVRLMAMTASVVYLIIIAEPGNINFAWKIGFNRSFDNVLAIVITMLISIYILPISTKSELAISQQRLKKLLIDMCEQIMMRLTKPTMAISNQYMIKALQLETEILALTNESNIENRLQKKGKESLIVQHADLLQISYFMVHLIHCELTQQNRLAQLMLVELLAVMQAIIHVLQNATTHSNGEVSLQLEKLLHQFECIRSNRGIADLSTYEVKYFYQFTNTLKLIDNILQVAHVN